METDFIYLEIILSPLHSKVMVQTPGYLRIIANRLYIMILFQIRFLWKGHDMKTH